MKSPPWLLVPAGTLRADSEVCLDDSEARHALGALRLRAGDRVVLADGAGSVAHGTLVVEGRRRVTVAIEGMTAEESPSEGLILAVAVLAGTAMDFVVQKSVEIGVAGLLPVITQRSQLDSRRAASRIDHWERVALQAIKQCRRAWAMDVLPATVFDELVSGPFAIHGVVAHRDGGDLRELPPEKGRLLLIGPEGGFSSGEERMLERQGWPRVRLGRFVLRSETAAIIGAASLVSRFDAGEHASDV